MRIRCPRLRGFWRKRRNLPATLTSDWQRRLDELEEAASEPAHRWDAEHDSHVLSRVLAIVKTDFEPATWQAFWHVVVDGEKPAVAAQRLGISLNAVRLAKVRVLRRLRQESAGLLE